ncbi:MAG: hypothetical protein QXX42_05040, partial [Thermoplasmatales archaeon]
MEEKIGILIDKIADLINSDTNLKKNFEEIIQSCKEIGSIALISETISSQENNETTKKYNIEIIDILIEILNKANILPRTAIEILYLLQIYILNQYPELREMADLLIS